MYSSSMNNYNIITVSVKINTLHFVNRPMKIVYAGYHIKYILFFRRQNNCEINIYGTKKNS